MADLLFEKRGPVAWLTINRPARKNTFTCETFVLLADAWDEVARDSDIRVAVLTGSGDRVFSAGADLGELIPLYTGARSPTTEQEQRFLADPDIMERAFLKKAHCNKPIVAAINGLTLGGGMELLQCTDIRIAADHAGFGLPEVKRGIVPGAGSLVRLIHQLPHVRAMEMLLTGNTYSAGQLYDWGFLNDVVPGDELLARADALAHSLCDNGPLAQQAIKECVRASQGCSWEQAFALERTLSARVMASEDAREGPLAFMEKRKPHYTGR